MLVDTTRTLRYVASSSEQMRLVELLELQHEEGPCLDAYRGGVVAMSTKAEEADARWPQFGTHARRRARVARGRPDAASRDDRIGALNLFSRRPGGLSDEDQNVAQALADIATIGVLQARAIHDGQVVATQLQTALESRIAIEQAKGILAENMAISVDDAFTLLRNHARTHNLKLTDGAPRRQRRAQPGDARDEQARPRAVNRPRGVTGRRTASPVRSRAPRVTSRRRRRSS